MKPIIILLILNLSIAIALSDIKISRCGNKDDETADETAGKIIKFLFEENPPKTQDDVNRICDNLMKGLDNLVNYTKTCLEKMPKQIMSTILYSLRQMRRRYCRNGILNTPAGKEFMKVMTCAAAVRPKMHECYNGIIDGLEYIIDLQNVTNKISLICCDYFRTSKCFLSGLEDSVCQKDAVQIAQQLLQSYSKAAIDIACNGYDESSDRCKNHIVPKDIRKRRFNSVFVPILIILAEIEKTDI